MWLSNFDIENNRLLINNSNYKNIISNTNPMRSVFAKIFNYLENLSDIWDNVNAIKNKERDYKNWFRVEADKWRLYCDWFNNRNQKRIEFSFYIPEGVETINFVQDFLLNWSNNKETILYCLKNFIDECKVKDMKVDQVEQARLKKEQEFEEYAKNFVA